MERATNGQIATMPIEFKLDGRTVVGRPDEPIIETAARHGVEIPRLCYKPGLRPDGNCRACVVEIKGERVLAPSCCRFPAAGMEVSTDSARARASQKMVLELLLSDMPEKEYRLDSELDQWARKLNLGLPRFPSRTQPAADLSHPAMAVNLDACIQCTRCVRACREEQVNDVIGLAHRGDRTEIVFDLGDPMALRNLVTDLRPEWIVHCPAATDVAWCETHPEDAERINAEASGTLASAAAAAGSRLLYVSTDAVFDGSRGPYAESDGTAPCNVYGRTKRKGEDLVQRALPSSLIVRTNLYGWNVQPKQSLAEWVLDRLEAGEKLGGDQRDVADQRLLGAPQHAAVELAVLRHQKSRSTCVAETASARTAISPM